MAQSDQAVVERQGLRSAHLVVQGERPHRGLDLPKAHQRPHPGDAGESGVELEELHVTVGAETSLEVDGATRAQVDERLDERATVIRPRGIDDRLDLNRDSEAEPIQADESAEDASARPHDVLRRDLVKLVERRRRIRVVGQRERAVAGWQKPLDDHLVVADLAAQRRRVVRQSDADRR